jgi:replicative DNA helicase
LDNWVNKKEILNRSLEYIRDRKNGAYKSIATKLTCINNMGLGGLESNSLYLVGARPGVGKTLFAQEITKDLQILNPGQKVAVINFQFDMTAINIGVRDIASINNIDIRYLQSVGRELSDDDFNSIYNNVNFQDEIDEYFIDTPMTGNQIIATIKEFYKKFRCKIVVTIDHTLLIVKEANEFSRAQTLENFAISLTNLKREIPVTVILLTQLNRDIDEPSRQVPGKIHNYVTPSDIFGSDYFQQCTDFCLGLNRPSVYNIGLYGPKKYKVEKYTIFLHKLKNRHGDTGLDFLRADYPTMTLHEIEEPSKEVD